MNLDLFIFSAFLGISLVLGILSSKKINDISEYALGNRNFSTPTMIATIIATWIGGGFFSYGLIETYRQGIYFIIPAIADCFGMMLIGWILAPRMGKFLGKISIAESMGQMFGTKVRIITVIFALIRCVGSLAVQFKVSSKVLELIFDTSGEFATILSAIIVILYSTIGGIRAVTFTDVIQFFTFGCLIPAIGVILWQAMGENDNSMVWNTLSTSPLFDLSAAFDLNNPKFYEMLGMFMMCLIPHVTPPIFQRISMGQNVDQITRSFQISGLISLVIQCIVIGIGILILSVNPNVNPDDLVKYIVNHYTYTGFKGLVAVGIMAMIMSSADSLINSASIIFAHDFCKPLGFRWGQNELLVARITAVVSGVIAIFLALHFDRVLRLVLSFTSLYMPIVVIPFIFAVLGFRSSGKSMMAAMLGSLIIIIIWRILLGKTVIESFIPSLIASITFLFGTHYLTKQPGGWIKIRMYDSNTEKIFGIKQLVSSIQNFDLTKLWEKGIPCNELIYIYTGIFCFFSFYLNLVTVNYGQEIFSNFLQYATPIVLFMATALFIYPLWPRSFKKHPILPNLVWHIFIFCSLVFMGFMLVITSNFAPTQVMTLIINLIVISILVRWQWFLVMIISGAFIAWKLTSNYFSESIKTDQISWKIQIIYISVLVNSLLLVFLKTKQEDIKQKATPETLCLDKKSQKIPRYYKKLNTAAISQMFFNFYK